MDRRILIKNVFKLILVLLIFNYSYLFQYIPIIIFKMDVKNISLATNVWLNFFANVCLMIVLALLYRKELVNEFKKFKAKFFDNINVGFNYWILGTFIMIVSNLIINAFFKTGGATNEQLVQKMISNLPYIMLLNAGLVAPFNEEIVFRKAFKNIIKNKYIFAIVSFLVFGFVHVLGNASSWVEYLYIIPYGALGAVFALADYKTDTVFTSISMHMFHNFFLTLLSIII